MQLILIHAADDSGAADAFEKALNGGRMFYVTRVPVGHAPAEDYPHTPVVLLWSARAAPFDRQLERIALEAWEENMLLIIALDASERPVGLRDLPAIFAHEPLATEVLTKAANALEWSITTGMRNGFPDYVRDRVEETLIAHARGEKVEGATPGGAGRLEYTGAWAYVPLAAIAMALAWYWLSARDIFLLICAAAIVFGAYLIYVAIRNLSARRNERVHGMSTETPLRAEARDARPSEIFVSYARADTQLVDQVLDGVRAAGAAFWIDRTALQSGTNWAGEIVRAIKAARGVLVMCSANAFGSDHVKREIYLADKYRKAIVPIFVEPAEPPDDFEYFLAGVQRLDWYRASNEERATALAAAVARF